MLISELPVVDDLDIGIDPDSYPDQANPAPPVEGNYLFRALKHSVRTTPDGQPQLTDGRWPVLVLDQVEIVEPQDCARKIMLFQNVTTKPFKRPENPNIPVSQLGDLLRAYDDARGARGLEDMKHLLQEYFDTNATFRGRLSWSAYDSEFVKAFQQKVGGREAFAKLPKEKQNEIYGKARLRGMTKFPKQANGTFSHIWQGPSGEFIEARAEISRYYPSSANVNLGAAGR